MALIGFLILFPLLVAGVLLLVGNETARRVIVCSSAVIIGFGSVWLVLANLGTPWVGIEFSSGAIDIVCTLIGLVIAAVILCFGVKYKNVLACVLAVVQVVGSLVFDVFVAHGIEVQYGLYLDSLTLVTTFIIGVVGSGICIYALGYMEDFQAHEPADAKDRRPKFFALMFLFLSAMYVIVFSNNLLWMFTGWEITTVCSFLLIGYTKTPEAINNAFRQIIMNLAGGIGFLVALFAIALTMDTLSLVEFIAVGVMAPALAALPAVALAFAGITKAAQMPFHTWLLGAMVAPTPTSALLHSSTMVKAGVFLLIKLSPIFLVCPVAAVMTILVGGLTFLLCSFMAISQTNAKRVLAYSTIANLGLIVACAGVGTPEAVWAATFLVLFHAVAKSLLFLCVGTAEHHIGSRDIEDMDLMFERMPRLARFMMAGIMIMFVAPFGMLIAKWGTLVSFADTGNVALILILGFGSAATFLFWAKWLGKLSGIAAHPLNVETTVHRSGVGRAHGHGRALHAVLRRPARPVHVPGRPTSSTCSACAPRASARRTSGLPPCFRPWCSWSCSAAWAPSRSSRFPSTLPASARTTPTARSATPCPARPWPRPATGTWRASSASPRSPRWASGLPASSSSSGSAQLSPRCAGCSRKGSVSCI